MAYFNLISSPELSNTPQTPDHHYELDKHPYPLMFLVPPSADLSLILVSCCVSYRFLINPPPAKDTFSPTSSLRYAFVLFPSERCQRVCPVFFSSSLLYNPEFEFQPGFVPFPLLPSRSEVREQATPPRPFHGEFLFFLPPLLLCIKIYPFSTLEGSFCRPVCLFMRKGAGLARSFFKRGCWFQTESSSTSIHVSPLVSRNVFFLTACLFPAPF